MRIITTAKASCATVEGEILARIAGQYEGAWHDPHNNGTYTMPEVNRSAITTITTDRYPGLKTKQPVADKITFTLTRKTSSPPAPPSESCLIEACSRSQVMSVLDYGTNYCNLEMLFCGYKDGCKAVRTDFEHSEEKLHPFSKANADISLCLQV